jgi:hypothetical protein
VPAVASSSPLSVLPAAELPDRPDGLSKAETITLVTALKSVPDPRQARGRRYFLQAILVLALTGVMAGARSWSALAQWAREGGQHRVRLCRPWVVLTCDGKTVRGSRTRAGKTTALFRIRTPAPSGLTQRAIENGDEIAAFAATLDTLPELHEVLISADALHAQREHAASFYPA